MLKLWLYFNTSFAGASSVSNGKVFEKKFPDQKYIRKCEKKLSICDSKFAILGTVVLRTTYVGDVKLGKLVFFYKFVHISVLTLNIQKIGK